jgi:hypothetical protein
MIWSTDDFPDGKNIKILLESKEKKIQQTSSKPQISITSKNILQNSTNKITSYYFS